MKKLILLILAATMLLPVSRAEKIPASVPARLKNGVIVLKEPAREPGQKSAVGMACDPIETVRVAFVGIGGRGTGAVALRTIHPARQKGSPESAVAAAGYTTQETVFRHSATRRLFPSQ